MPNTDQIKFDATTPFYAAVGAGDLAMHLARTAAHDVQTRITALDLEPHALREQARTVFVARVDELNKDVQARIEARVTALQADAKALPSRVEALLNERMGELNITYADLAARGKVLVGRIRGQEATEDAKAAAKNTVAKAKTTGTQATKTAKTAKRSSASAKSSAKATGTAAKKTATAAKKAAEDAADKTGD
jgi:hypothetical protein